MPHFLRREWIASGLIAAIIFTAPFNLFFKLTISDAYVHGLLVDYLIPKFYISDLFILALLMWWGINKLGSRFKNWRPSIVSLATLVLIMLLVLRQFFTTHNLASLWFGVKLLEFISLVFVTLQYKKVFKEMLFYGAIISALILQSLLGSYQFIYQHSLAPYYFFGEVDFKHSLGLAKDTFNDHEKILPYGSTAHPNILAGMIVVYWLIASLWLLKHQPQTKPVRFIWLLATLIGGSVLFLTQSFSAMAMLITGIVAMIMNTLNWPTKKSTAIKILSIISCLVLIPGLMYILSSRYDDVSITRRNYLNQAAIKMFLDQPLLGVGLNNFTAHVEEHSPSREVVRFVQPVHHVGLLWIAETGVIGLGCIILGFEYLRRHSSVTTGLVNALFILCPILALDHYLLTNQLGLWLLVILSAVLIQQRRSA
ncbi:MAG TPA: O-antigen ligase family protein [Vitreimonas sp.]|nr:O-antigen ligase family protein [Vitreimonas sp.]